ncbi:MAG: hypothetical protein E2O39_03605 [Planctomycetota bacterium]|nr:MAG: hypothetical protein E2O39_03605 [Planctomycetota bacterium]
MSNTRLYTGLCGTLALLLPACGGIAGSGSSSDTEGQMTLNECSNGFGQLVPYTVRKLDSNGVPTSQIISIRTVAELVDNVNPSNPIQAPPQFPTTALLPSGLAGNQFIYANLTEPIDISTVLEPSPGGLATSGLTGAVTVTAVDPLTGNAQTIAGRAFIDGQTYELPIQPNGQLTLQRWVEVDPFGNVLPVISNGIGFPGTQGSFNGAGILVSPNTIVFVVDADGDLSTYETFPTGKQIRMRIGTSVKATNGNSLDHTVVGSSTVGPDTLNPEILTTPPPLNSPLISPGNGDTNVDPLTHIRVEFTEPVQPYSVGDLFDGTVPTQSSSILIQFGPSTARTTVPHSVLPISIFDMSVFELIPAFNFPGAGPGGVCEDDSDFSVVDITVNPSNGPTEPLLQDLAINATTGLGNGNTLGAFTSFTTGEGPGIVNAPVAPDTITIGRLGAAPGLSILDLNGFGQSTGNPVYHLDDTLNPTIQQGDTNFPNNPNVKFQGSLLRPPLVPGTCTVDGGSAGVFTLTKDTALNDLLVRPPLVTSIGDMMLGQALDAAFDNAQTPFGCQAGGGQICTLDGLKIVSPAVSGPNTLGPLVLGGFSSGLSPGSPNIISWAPHPNPPPLTFPPLCVAPFIGAREPTSIDNSLVQIIVGGNPAFLTNLLVPGDPFGSPTNVPPIPASGLITPEQNAFFLGPSQGQTQISACFPYQIRQQIGQFLYVIDRQRGEVIVFNSNRMTVIDRIVLPDPTSMAMGTNLDFLAITNQQANVVSFIDINPNSSTFHQIIKSTVVGNAPRGIAWEPGNEDILVCDEGSGTLSIISAFSLEVRRVVSSQLNLPFEVAVLPRQVQFSFLRNVYFAYILNRTGTVAMYESGPNGVNGWGFDDVIGTAPTIFSNPKTIQVDPIDLDASVWIVHEGKIDIFNQTAIPGNTEGAISRLSIESAATGTFLLGGLTTAAFRDLQLAIQVSVGEDQLSGIPVDFAFDNLRNIGGLPHFATTFSAGAPAPTNGKSTVRIGGVLTTFSIANTNEALFMFAAIPNAVGASGVIDVIDIAASGAIRRDTNPFLPGIQSIPAPNVNILMDYYRQ